MTRQQKNDSPPTPKGIIQRGKNFRWAVMIKSERYSGTAVTLEDAIKARDALINKKTLKQLYNDDPRFLGGAINAMLKGEWSETECKSHEYFVTNTQIILEFFKADTPLKNITSRDIDRFILWLRDVKRNSNGTINRKLAALSKIFRRAIEKEYIYRKPYIPHLKETEGRIRFISEEEENKILNFFDTWGYEDIKYGVIVLIDTGIRTGELYRLTMPDIDWEQGKHGIVKLYDTKNGENRAVPLTERAANALKEWFRKYSPDGLHFTHRTRYWIRDAWAKMRHVLNYDDDEFFVPHVLRHTCASRLVQKGVPLYSISKWMGHKSIVTTKRYAHLRPDDLYDLVDLLE